MDFFTSFYLNFDDFANNYFPKQKYLETESLDSNENEKRNKHSAETDGTDPESVVD